MALKAGIIGLPNVGKSTLFNAITKKNILAANYPFATIDPNVGVVTVPDKRLDTLNEMYSPERLIPTQYEFIDIAGLVTFICVKLYERHRRDINIFNRFNA